MYTTNYEKIVSSLNLTDKQKEAVYRVKQFEYAVEDVRMHIKDMHDNDTITKEEELYALEHVKELAERFIYKCHDCSQAENDVYESMIHDFLRDNLKKFKVPVTWEVCGTVEVYAESAEKANLYVRDNYVDDSFRLSSDNLEENIAMTEMFDM